MQLHVVVRLLPLPSWACKESHLINSGMADHAMQIHGGSNTSPCNCIITFLFLPQGTIALCEDYWASIESQYPWDIPSCFCHMIFILPIIWSCWDCMSPPPLQPVYYPCNSPLCGVYSGGVCFSLQTSAQNWHKKWEFCVIACIHLRSSSKQQ